MSDRSRLAEALAEYLTEFGQRRWYVNERYWERTKLAFIHAKKRVPHGVDEILVTASIAESGRTRLHRYALLEGRKEWILCDEESFHGFLEEGPRGLKRGQFRQVPTTCHHERKVYRSSGRAQKFAKAQAARYGKTGVQRPYRCDENPRAYHLTAQQKGSREQIPDAYINPGLSEPW